MSVTNLSEFLHIIHDCQKDDLKLSGQVIIGQLLAIQKADIYGDEKLKGIYTGARPLLPKDIEDKTKKDKVPEFKKYFSDLLDEDKAQTLFAKFGIEKDEKVDFQIMCESIAMQYQNFTRYGDENNTTVKSIYEALIDSQGYASDPNANEKAINAAYQMFFNALSCLCRINPIYARVEDMKEPIESFMQNISQVYTVLFVRMNRVGKISYKGLREKYIRKIPEINKFLNMASEPGALPIDLYRRIELTVYDFPKMFGYHVTGELDLDEEYTEEKLIEGLESVKEMKEYVELFFSEFVVYHLKDEEENIAKNVYVLAFLTKEFLKNLAKEVFVKPNDKLMNDVREKYMDAQRLKIAFNFDGSYYRPTKTIKYGENFETMFFDKDGNVEMPGDKKIPFENNNRNNFYGETYDEVLKRFTAYELSMYISFKDDPMNEILVINADKTMRLYMFRVTCKAKMYRVIREIMYNCAVDHAVAIYSAGIVVDRDITDKKTLLLPAEERQKAPGGRDICSIFSCLWNKVETNDYLCSDLKKNIIKKMPTKIKNNIFRPLVLTLIGIKAEGFSYGSVFKDLDPDISKKPDSE